MVANPSGAAEIMSHDFRSASLSRPGEAPFVDISNCLVHRTRHHMAICMRNDEHCAYATPFGNECRHPQLDQIAEAELKRPSGADEFLSVISKRVFELTSTASVAHDLDSSLKQIIAILLDSRALPLDPLLAIVLASPRKDYFQVAQYGMTPTWKTAFRWQTEFFERADVLPGGLVRSSTLDDAALGGRRKVLLVPLEAENKLTGYAVLFTGLSYQPTPAHLCFLSELAQGISGVVQRSITREILQMRDFELGESRTTAFHSLALASQYRDDDTGWHIMRMTQFAVTIAKAMGLSEKQRDLLRQAAPMHDVGKIGIPDSILLKPAGLTPDEFDVIKSHTIIGANILAGKDPLIAAARDIARSHHERWDGTGYPDGLAGENISVLARICAVADVFDALLSTRPYKKPWTVEMACEWIVSESGKSFDPAVVRAFEATMPEILRIRELYRDDVIDPHKSMALLPLPPRASAWVKWNESLSTGIDTIDEHHRYLFDLINDLFEVVKHKRGAGEIAKLLKATDAYAQVHFRTEEQMMRHYGYDGIYRQEQQHHAFEARIQEFYEELHENPLVAQFNVLSYLRDWLIHHISIDDAELRSLTRA
jgi:hemerythrin-like metal-binding protein